MSEWKDGPVLVTATTGSIEDADTFIARVSHPKRAISWAWVDKSSSGMPNAVCFAMPGVMLLFYWFGMIKVER